MGTKRDRGPTAERVAANIKDVRLSRRVDGRQMTLDDVAARLRELGHPIIKTGLSKLESGERRVDVDDLVALAVALETNVNRLLLGADAKDDDVIELAPNLSSTSMAAWRWACGEYSIGAGKWPWAKFAEHGGNPSELRRFQEEARPHDPPLYLAPEEWERLQPLRRAFDEIFFAMKERGFAPDDFKAVLRMFSEFDRGA